MSLEFDEASHTYTFDGIVIPSVTQVLKPLTDYSAIDPATLKIAQEKGKAIHKMVELDCSINLDEAALPEWMRPALERWRQFVSESGFSVIASEQRVHSLVYGYAGTLDLYGEMRGHKVIIDIKRSFLAGSVIGFQLAGYRATFMPEDRNIKRYALRLTEKGPYRLIEYADKNDFNHFLTCLAFHNLKTRIST